MGYGNPEEHPRYEEFAKRGCGVLTRSGKWYPCAYAEHHYIIRRLRCGRGTLVVGSDYQDYYIQPKDWYTVIEGALSDNEPYLTAAQEKTLRRLISESNDPLLRDALEEGLELWSREHIIRRNQMRKALDPS